MRIFALLCRVYSVPCRVDMLSLCSSVLVTMIRADVIYLHIHETTYNDTPVGRSQRRTRNSSGDEIANVNFLYDDIVYALKIQ